MSTPAEHYAAAEEWLRRAQQSWEAGNDWQHDIPALSAATIAQVHMTAATATRREVHIHAQALRDVASKLNEYAKTAYTEGADQEARGYVVARGILTDRADALESGTN